MKVAELIEELKQLDPAADVSFRVCGNVSMKQELTGRYSGVYDLDTDVDTEAELDSIENNGEITLWI